MQRTVERNGVVVTEFLPYPTQALPNVSVAEVILKNRKYPPHPHKEACNNECDVGLYVVWGLIELTIGEDTIVAKAGDAAYVPKGTWYRIERIELDTVPFTKLVHTASPPYTLEQHVFR